MKTVTAVNERFELMIIYYYLFFNYTSKPVYHTIIRIMCIQLLRWKP